MATIGTFGVDPALGGEIVFVLEALLQAARQGRVQRLSLGAELDVVTDADGELQRAITRVNEATPDLPRTLSGRRL